MTGVGGHFRLASGQLVLELVMLIRILLDQVLLKRVLDIGRILLIRRYPAIADEQAFKVPRCFPILLVAIEDRFGDVRNMLSSV